MIQKWQPFITPKSDPKSSFSKICDYFFTLLSLQMIFFYLVIKIIFLTSGLKIRSILIVTLWAIPCLLLCSDNVYLSLFIIKLGSLLLLKHNIISPSIMEAQKFHKIQWQLSVEMYLCLNTLQLFIFRWAYSNFTQQTQDYWNMHFLNCADKYQNIISHLSQLSECR